MANYVKAILHREHGLLYEVRDEATNYPFWSPNIAHATRHATPTEDTRAVVAIRAVFSPSQRAKMAKELPLDTRQVRVNGSEVWDTSKILNYRKKVFAAHRKHVQEMQERFGREDKTPKRDVKIFFNIEEFMLSGNLIAIEHEATAKKWWGDKVRVGTLQRNYERWSERGN